MTVLFGKGTSTFARRATYTAPLSPDLLGITGIEAGDVDGDSDQGADAASPVYADFTGDGRRDLLAITGLPLYGLDTVLSLLPGLGGSTSAVSDPKSPISTSVLGLSAPWPNPGRGPTHFTLYLAEAQAVRVEALDVLGRRVALLHNGEFAAGTHALTLDGTKLTAGVYLIRVTGKAATASRRAVIVH